MSTVTLSRNFQIVIPRNIRNQMKLTPGEKFQVVALNDNIELIPIRPISEMRGFLKGLNPAFNREKEDRI